MFGPAETRTTISFRCQGERALPVALASMTAKYLRELAMRAFNDYWCRRFPIAPTAGYSQDARRFKKQIAPLQTALGIDDRQLCGAQISLRQNRNAQRILTRIAPARVLLAYTLCVRASLLALRAGVWRRLLPRANPPRTSLMFIYVVRHAWAGQSGDLRYADDSLRPLTEKGTNAFGGW